MWKNEYQYSLTWLFCRGIISLNIKIKSLPKCWTPLKATILESNCLLYSEYNHPYFLFSFTPGMLLNLNLFAGKYSFLSLPFLSHTINNSSSFLWHFHFISSTWLTHFCFWVPPGFFILPFNLGDLKLDTKF